MIALDSTMMRPSSISIIGTRPLGFLARYAAVRVSPFELLVSIQLNGRASCVSSNFNLWQLPDGEKP